MTHIVTDHKWKDFLYEHEVPPRVLEVDFDYLEPYEMTDSFLKYRDAWFHLSEFVNTAPNPHWGTGSTELKERGWHGYITTSAFSAVVIRLSEDNEQYQIGTAHW